jgi:hypothetical protein
VASKRLTLTEAIVAKPDTVLDVVVDDEVQLLFSQATPSDYDPDWRRDAAAEDKPRDRA